MNWVCRHGFIYLLARRGTRRKVNVAHGTSTVSGWRQVPPINDPRARMYAFQSVMAPAAPAGCPTAPPTPAAIPICCVTDDPNSGTPQTAYNDAAGITGSDPDPQPPNKFHAPGNAETVSGGRYVPYVRHKGAILRYGPWAGAGNVSKANRRLACGWRSPFALGRSPGPPDAAGWTRRVMSTRLPRQ